MADYNIYIRTVGGGDGSGSPTTPFQTGGGDDTAQQVGAFVSQAGSFANNPDSAISSVMNTATGAVASKLPWIAAAAIIVKTVVSIADSVYSKYTEYTSAATGDVSAKVRYNNWKQNIDNFFHPFRSAYQLQLNKLEIAKENAKKEQEMMLFGGTITNSPNGRYL